LKNYQQLQAINEDVTTRADFLSLIANHKNFHSFVEIISFEDYLKNFTNFDSNKKSSSTKENNEEDIQYLLKSLTESASSPDVISLIVNNLLGNKR
jgi:hypothetical protein